MVFKRRIVILAGLLAIGMHCDPALGGEVLRFESAIWADDPEIDGLDGASDVVVGPGGEQVYAVSVDDSTLSVFGRNPTDGSLTQIEVHKDGIGGVDGLGGTERVIVSADGKNVYVTGLDDEAIAVFSRDENTGLLTFVESHFNDFSSGVYLQGPRPGISPDGKHVYVSSYPLDSIAVFSRALETGSLTFVGIIEDGVNGVAGLDGPVAVAISGDSQNVYVSTFTDDAVVVFSRDYTTGLLSYRQHHSDGVGGIDSLGNPDQLIVSRDGKNVYVPAQGDDSISVFERDLVTGDLTYLNALVDGIGGVDGLNGSHAATETPDNRYLLVTGWHDDAVSVFSIDSASGDLSFVEAFFDGIDGVDGLFNAAGIATDSSGSHAYVTGRTDNALVTFSLRYSVFSDGFESSDTSAWSGTVQ